MRQVLAEHAGLSPFWVELEASERVQREVLVLVDNRFGETPGSKGFWSWEAAKLGRVDASEEEMKHPRQMLNAFAGGI